MLTSVAHFLFGGSQAENTPSVEEHDLKTTPVEDHEWVIVDHAKDTDSNSDTSADLAFVIEHCYTDSDSDSLNNAEKHGNISYKRLCACEHHECNTHKLTNSRDENWARTCMCKHKNKLSLTESWLLTPSPCFITGSTTPHEPAPLDDVENMLIEHTSMSVYDNVRQLRPRSATAPVSKSAKPVKCRARERRQRQSALQKQAPRRAPVVAARAGLIAQAEPAIIKTIQRLQSEKTSRSNTRKNLERDNKRNISFKTNGKHRHERVMRPTGRMNVRAC